MAHPLSAVTLEKQLYSLGREAGVKGLRKPKSRKEGYAEVGLDRLITQITKHSKGRRIMHDFFDAFPKNGRSIAKAVNKQRFPVPAVEVIQAVSRSAYDNRDADITKLVAQALGYESTRKALNKFGWSNRCDVKWGVYNTAYETESLSAARKVADTALQVKKLAVNDLMYTCGRVAEVSGSAHLVKRTAALAGKYKDLPLKYTMYCLFEATNAVEEKRKDVDYLRGVIAALHHKGLRRFSKLCKANERTDFMLTAWEIAAQTGDPDLTYLATTEVAGHHGKAGRSYLRNIRHIAEYTKGHRKAIRAAMDVAGYYQDDLRAEFLPLVMNTLGDLALHTESGYKVGRAADALTTQPVFDVMDYYQGNVPKAMNHLVNVAKRTQSPNQVSKAAQKYLRKSAA